MPMISPMPGTERRRWKAPRSSPLAQKFARGAKASRVDAGAKGVSAAQELGDLPAVELVALGLEAVNRAHSEGVAEGERDALGLADVGEPIPDEETLAADDESRRSERRQGVEQGLGSGREMAVQEHLPRAIEAAWRHASERGDRCRSSRRESGSTIGCRASLGRVVGHPESYRVSSPEGGLFELRLARADALRGSVRLRRFGMVPRRSTRDPLADQATHVPRLNSLGVE